MNEDKNNIKINIQINWSEVNIYKYKFMLHVNKKKSEKETIV